MTYPVTYPVLQKFVQTRHIDFSKRVEADLLCFSLASRYQTSCSANWTRLRNRGSEKQPCAAKSAHVRLCRSDKRESVNNTKSVALRATAAGQLCRREAALWVVTPKKIFMPPNTAIFLGRPKFQKLRKASAAAPATPVEPKE